MSERIERPRPHWLAIAALTLFAPASGGATQLWAQAVLLALVGLFFVLVPPRRALSPRWTGLFVALGLLGLIQFLPAAWAPWPGWRKTFTSGYGVVLPGTRTAQPWLSLESYGVYLAGLGWAYYLMTEIWTPSARQKAVRFYGLGVVVLAGVCLGVLCARTKVPFWPLVGNSPINFGFFPNRNQTANVLALGGVMLSAVAFQSFAYHGKRGALWLPPILLVCAAVVVAYSRAGVMLFFGGTASWLGATIPTAVSKKIGTLCLSGVVLILAAFLLYGGDTLKRFQPEPSDNVRQWTDFRFRIQEDAVDLSAQSPVFGQGLGTFEYLFPLFRDRSAGQNFALHPESDWLWAAAEMGWLPTLLLFIGVCCWLPMCFPFDKKSDRRLRSAAAICAVAFVLHGMADVSGHRPGAAWPALFFFSIALHPKRRLQASLAAPHAFRALGVILLGFAAWWLASDRLAWGDQTAPTARTLVRLKAHSDDALAVKQYDEMIALTTTGLRLAPLDWRLYFQRAVANAVSYNTSKAKEDFARARYLVPQWADSCFIEGELWLALDKPEYGWDAWKEALRRSGDTAPDLYRRMLSEQQINSPVRRELEELARTSRAFWLVFLDFANPLECDLQIGDLLAQDPALLTLTPAQRQHLFATWYLRGNRALLITSLLAYPNWLPQGWAWVAQDYVVKGDYRAAFELAMRFTPAPPFPKIDDTRPINEIERNFFFHQEDLQYGISLFFAQRRLHRNTEALKTLLLLRKIPGHPSYLAFLEGTLHAEQGEWEQAWKARLDYGPLAMQ